MRTGVLRAQAAELTLTPLAAAVVAKDAVADALLGRISDEIWNIVGRPAADPALAVLFPGGVAYYAEGATEAQPDRMEVLAQLLVAGIHPKLPKDKAASAAAEVTAAGGGATKVDGICTLLFRAVPSRPISEADEHVGPPVAHAEAVGPSIVDPGFCIPWALVAASKDSACCVCTFVHTLWQMFYEWDPPKARANRANHGVSFADAVGVFEDRRALTTRDAHASEERFVTLGFDFLARLLVVCWTQRDNRIRLISARKATRAETNEYEKG